jgi:hypothetical protein
MGQVKQLKFLTYFCLIVLFSILISSCAGQQIVPSIKTLSTEQSKTSEQNLESKANGLTSKDPKDATMEDVKSALDMAAEAQKTGSDEIANDIHQGN